MDSSLKAQIKCSRCHLSVIAKVSPSTLWQQLSSSNMQSAQWLQVRPWPAQPLPYVHWRANGHQGGNGVAAVWVAATAAVSSRQPHRSYLHRPQLHRLLIFQSDCRNATLHLCSSITMWSPTIVLQAPVSTQTTHSFRQTHSKALGWIGTRGQHKIKLTRAFLCPSFSGSTPS